MFRCLSTMNIPVMWSVLQYRQDTADELCMPVLAVLRPAQREYDVNIQVPHLDISCGNFLPENSFALKSRCMLQLYIKDHI